MERLSSNVPTYRFVAQLHYETSDARVVFDHLYEGLAGEVSSVACHYRQEDLLLFAKVEGGVLLPEIQEVPCSGLSRIDLICLRCPPESTGLHQTVVMILRKSPQFWSTLHPVSSFPLPCVHRLTSVTKPGRLHPRLHVFPKRTGSTADLKRISSSVDREVG